MLVMLPKPHLWRVNGLWCIAERRGSCPYTVKATTVREAWNVYETLLMIEIDRLPLEPLLV